MSEKKIEAKLRREIKKLGGQCLKFISPMHSGVTDRIVMVPLGLIWFVETKKSKKEGLEPLQISFKKLLDKQGQKHRVVDDEESLSRFLAEVRECIQPYRDVAYFQDLGDKIFNRKLK